MSVTISNQVFVFFSCIIGGGIIGIVFDLFRFSRRVIQTSDVLTYIEDIVFWIIVGAVVLLTVFECNNGQLRGYIFLGMILGVIFYMTLISRYFILILEAVIKILAYIIVWVIKVFRKPVKILIIIISKPLIYFSNKANNLFKRLFSMSKRIYSQIRRTKKIIKEKV